GIPTVRVFSEDDAGCLHVRHVDAARPLSGRGPRAYLDVEQLIAVARETGCDAVHPGYGFLSEQAGFARRCAEAGLTFVGPRPETLALLGDKVAARALAERCGVPVLRGTSGPAGLAEARAFLAALGDSEAALVKAVAGGGRRGGRVARRPQGPDPARARRRSGVGAFEFLLDADEPSRLVFIEANPRLQVEHTVTEEVTGIDLVVTQLALAAGRSLADLGLRQEEIAAPHGFALQVRVNMET